MATLSVRPPARQHGLVRASSRRAGVLTLALLGLLFVCLLSLAVGSRPIGLGTSIDALTHYDASNPDHVIVHDVRVPRTLIGLMVGTALGLAGALMQGVTRNPLADPGVLGVTAGAALAVVIAIYTFDVSSLSQYVWFAFVGAGLASVIVYLLGSPGRG